MQCAGSHMCKRRCPTVSCGIVRSMTTRSKNWPLDFTMKESLVSQQEPFGEIVRVGIGFKENEWKELEK